jgi:hypothetical protein
VNGANPLAFLAALGTLHSAAATNAGQTVAMSWTEGPLGWTPTIHGVPLDRSTLAQQIARHLNCPFQPNERAELARQSAQNAFDTVRAKHRDAEARLKKQGLKGNERKAEENRVLEPLRAELAGLRAKWLESLAKSVPSLELALGKHLNATWEEFREMTERALGDSSAGARGIVDLLASFGSDGCRAKNEQQIQATAFCFITGSGHQYFLDTVRQLTARLDAPQFEHALFQRAEPRDERLSMRWDPLEDRRYALMWSDPNPSDNVARTNWALNLLAYRGLSLIPSVPTTKGLRTTGWSGQREPTWTWPIWRGRASVHVARSLLSHPALTVEKPDLGELSGLLHAAYRSNRIQVGNPPLHKVNFTPAHRVA